VLAYGLRLGRRSDRRDHLGSQCLGPGCEKGPDTAGRSMDKHGFASRDGVDPLHQHPSRETFREDCGRLLCRHIIWQFHQRIHIDQPNVGIGAEGKIIADAIADLQLRHILPDGFHNAGAFDACRERKRNVGAGGVHAPLLYEMGVILMSLKSLLETRRGAPEPNDHKIDNWN
jgi:hypothetical protein